MNADRTIVTTLTGRCLSFHDDPLDAAQEGDVWLQPKLDAVGRAHVRGRHTNFGYSGYIAGFVQAAAGRRRFLSWREIFSKEENCYLYAHEQSEAIQRVKGTIEALRGHKIHQVKGGWELVSLERIAAAVEAGSRETVRARLLAEIAAKTANVIQDHASTAMRPRWNRYTIDVNRKRATRRPKTSE